MTMPEPSPLSEQELDALQRIAETANITSRRWVAGAAGGDGNRLVYAPNRGPMRMVVPIANSTDPFAEFIASLSPVVALRLIAQARAARPSPTCATCKHLGRASDETGERYAYCKALRGFDVTDTPDNFGCTLHEPSPPSQDGGSQ